MAFLSEMILMIQPFLIAYLLDSTIHNHTLAIWISGYLTITLYVLWTIWPDEHHSPWEKLVLSIYAPVMYFSFFIMDAIQTIAIFKCLFNVKKVIDRT